MLKEPWGCGGGGVVTYSKDYNREEGYTAHLDFTRVRNKLYSVKLLRFCAEFVSHNLMVWIRTQAILTPKAIFSATMQSFPWYQGCFSTSRRVRRSILVFFYCEIFINTSQNNEFKVSSDSGNVLDPVCTQFGLVS